MLTRRPTALKTLYVSAVVLTALFAIACYGLLSHNTNAQLAASEHVSLSLQQRTQMQTIAFLASRLVAVSDTAEQESIRAEMGEAITTLLSAQEQLSDHPDSDEIRAITFELNRQTELLVQAARELADSDAPSPDTPAYQTIVELRPALFSGTTALADQYQRESDESANWTKGLQRLLLALMLVTLGVESFLVFRPMERYIQHHEQRLRESADTLRRTEELYRLLVREMPNSGVVMFDRDLRYTLVDGPLYRGAGIVMEDPTGKTLHETMPEETIQFLLPIYQRVLQGEVFTFERTMPNDLSYQSYATPIRDETGQIIGGLILSHDTTALRRSEKRYRQMFELNHAVKLVVDPENGQIVEANQAACDFYGYTREQLQGMLITQINILSEAEIFAEMARTKAKKHAVLQFRHRLASGEIRDVEIFSGPLEVGSKSYLFSIVQDITARKHLEEALRSNEERLRQITNSVQDVITQSDADDHITFASPSYRTVLGYDPEFMLSRSGMAFIHPDDRAAFMRAFEAAHQSEDHQFVVEGRIQHADGHYIWGEIAGKMLFDDQSNCIGAVSVTRDITERKRVQELLLEQEKLHTALEKEQELHELKSRMMRRIVHEFRTPLAIIQTSTETLNRYLDQLSAEQRAAKARATKDGVWRIRDMLDEIGLVLQGGLAPEDLELVPTDLGAICRESIQRLEKQFDPGGHYVFDITERVMISADPTVLENAIMHVLRNAARFSEPSDVVTVCVAKHNNGAELRVSDTGIGILPQEQMRIFEPFFRGSNIGEMRGLGLGLTIARAAVEAHHGTVSIVSTPEHGTTVTLWLPAL